MDYNLKKKIKFNNKVFGFYLDIEFFWNIPFKEFFCSHEIKPITYKMHFCPKCDKRFYLK